MYSSIHLPFVDMREQPTLQSKVVSQALFGEEVQVAHSSEGWISITTPDGYSGWVPDGSIVVREKPYPKDLEISRIKAHVYKHMDTEFGPILSLPHGSQLHLVETVDSRWLKILLPDGREAYVQKGDVEPEPFDLIPFAKKFLGIPYTWGGRSSFGYDCSGFVQMLYGRLGICLPRDARQQVLAGKPILVDQLVLGDLIFWGKSETNIGHVGMYLGEGEFIHTSSRENKPYLRISRLTDLEWRGDGKAYYPYRCVRRY
jgi:hypothetical protein